MANMYRARLASNNKPRFRLLFIPGNPAADIAYNDAYLIIGVIRELSSAPTLYLAGEGDVEDIATLGTYAAPSSGKCRWKAIDNTNLEGLYELQFAEALFDSSDASRYVSIFVTMPGDADIRKLLYEVELGSLDPQANGVTLADDAITSAKFDESSAYPQTGDAYAVVAHADYGNAKLVRSTTPANTLTVDASHQALADVSAISGDSTAADRLEAILDAMPGGAVVDDNDPDPTATAFETNLSEATNDHYNGAFVVFTSGALLGQSRKISDYDGTSKVLTVAAAFTEVPTAGDTFLILGRSE